MVGEENGMPTIMFSNRVRKILAHSMETAIIVKLLGKTIGYKALQSKILLLWKPKEDFKIVDLENGYFLIHFDGKDDYLHALLNGPWSIYGSYLTVQPWSPMFNASEIFPASAVVWVRFPGMPLEYYHKSTLRSIAMIIGRMEKIDYATENGNRGKFARVAISIDLAKPLISRFKIDGRVQEVEYEDLPTICYSCGRFGHVVETCTFQNEAAAVANPNTSTKEVQQPKMVKDFPVTGPNLGPWMHVQKRGPRKYGKGGSSGNNGGGNSGSRYDILAELEDFNNEDDTTNLDNLMGDDSVDIIGTSRVEKNLQIRKTLTNSKKSSQCKSPR